MPRLVDRRLNPKGKSLGNRQRFMRRARAQIKEAVNKAIQNRGITDPTAGEKISIPSKGIREPRFRHATDKGKRDRLLPGNKDFVPGDLISKPQGGGAGKSKKASDSGEGEDDFTFSLTAEEFLSLFFEDLELPDLVKTSLKEVISFKPLRAGFSTSGTTTNINVVRTMCNSFGRRLALKRPKQSDIERSEKAIKDLQNDGSALTYDQQRRLLKLQAELEELERRKRLVPFIDPIDIRYNRFEQMPQPKTKAVMFCLMDVSGSMGAREKDLAKRFFLLLHLFLKQRYKQIEVVFIRHTHHAQEVDEDTFFYSRESGGTVVSTALVEMLKVIGERYPAGEWNIYAAQASDGDNIGDDTARCTTMLHDEVLPLCQYYAYVEILDERELQLFQNTQNGKALWRGYRDLSDVCPNFAMKRIALASDIYPVFRELFAKPGRAA